MLEQQLISLVYIWIGLDSFVLIGLVILNGYLFSWIRETYTKKQIFLVKTDPEDPGVLSAAEHHIQDDPDYYEEVEG